MTTQQLPRIYGEAQFKPYDGFSTSGVISSKLWSGQSKLGAQNNASQNPYGFTIDFGGNQAHENRSSFITAYMYKRTL